MPPEAFHNILKCFQKESNKNFYAPEEQTGLQQHKKECVA